jgi:hypothetical protein
VGVVQQMEEVEEEQQTLVEGGEEVVDTDSGRSNLGLGSGPVLM